MLVTMASISVTAAPDEDELGKAEGYPYQRMGPALSMLIDKYKIGNFTSMDQIFWPREVANASPVRALSKASKALAVRYEYGGRSFTIEDILARQRITGLLILKDETVVYEAYQYDRTATSKFASFSMAKTVVGLLTGIAVGEGRIASLDDPATKYAPDLRGTVYAKTSVRDLLRMSSGAKWSDHVVGQPNDVGQLSADTYFQRARGGASSLQRVRESVAAPGTVFNYSSADTFALGLVVRGAIGGDLSDYASQKLWKPMGAETSASWLTDWSGVEAAFCCLNARLRDYGRLGMLLAADGEYNGRQIIPREFLLDATDPVRQPEYMKPRKATPFFGYGYQTWLYPYRTRTFQARGLLGQEIIVQPSSRVVVVITSALRTPHVPNDLFVERNLFVGAVLKALGGQADVHR